MDQLVASHWWSLAVR